MKKLFVIDDERSIANTLAIILRKSGYDVTAFYDAESAIEYSKSVRPEIVVSDVAMPGMNGIDLAILLSERFPNCKIILFSGHASTADLLEDAHRRGHTFDILAKPVPRQSF